MVVPMNSAKFYSAIRETLFHPLTPTQVEGVNSILDAWTKWAPASDARDIAYSLATAYWETGRAMQPIREAGEGRGRAYGHPAGPWHAVYYGRGLVQETWLANYQHADAKLHILGLLNSHESLVKTPDLALRPDVAAAIMVRGMVEGWFTGKRLADYFLGAHSDWQGARRIINGQDKAALIAGLALQFYHALTAAEN
jgi:putative chitinase